MVLQIKLTADNSQKVDELARQTGRSPDDLVNDAVGRLIENVTHPGPKWKSALMQAAGMWKDRDDIPELMEQLRREMNRVEPPDNPEPL